MNHFEHCHDDQNQKDATRLTCDTFADFKIVDCYRYIFYSRVFCIARYFIRRAAVRTVCFSLVFSVVYERDGDARVVGQELTCISELNYDR